jgi:uncharacterized protein
MTRRLIIVGASTRAAAQSAARSGFQPWCIDQFGDQDLRECAEHVEVVENWPDGILKVIPRIPPGTLVIGGALENSPRVLRRLCERLTFAGCDVDSMRALRDPVSLQQMLQQAGLNSLQVSLSGRPGESTDLPPSRWLKKPLKSAAGFHVRFHEPVQSETPVSQGGARLPGFYFQEFVEGEPISGLFLSSGDGCRLIGLTRQLTGLPEAGCSGFRYCGSVGPLTPVDLSPRTFELAGQTGTALADATGIRGLFGCDFLWNARAGTLHVCEVNPRYTASAEVFESSGTASLLGLHVGACRGKLPELRRTQPVTDGRARYSGKLICFAKRQFPAADLNQLSGKIQIADIPSADLEIPTGHPICTVLATGKSEAVVRSRLLDGASQIDQLATFRP